MMKFAKWISFLLLSGTALAGEDLARRVLVVYNEAEPESKPLAEYYAQRRGVPASQICPIHVRNAETITRKEFNEQIREPIRRFLNDHGLLFQLPLKINLPGIGPTTIPETYDNKITFVALIYGVPLRIESDPGLKEPAIDAKTQLEPRRDEAAVDSELTWLPNAGLRLSLWAPNPFFNKSPPVFDEALNHKMVLVSRLDGPDAKTVRRMIDDALATERTGLLGRCYIDAQGNQNGAYAEGDRWIKDTGKLLRAAGFETEIDEKPALFDENYRMKDAAVYAGWYAPDIAGPFKRADFKFRPGAIAYHLHSLSAFTMRTRTDSWAAPLLARGAVASFGNVWEPYLLLTPHVDLFFKRLLAGASFAEAGWYSEPGLSWQTTFVGDPLYRPFALSVDSQIARLEADKNPDVAWAYLRKINLLLATGDTVAAEKLCAEKAAALHSEVLIEKLGALQLAHPKKN
jgi:uncharacterized protein (TIGR03790 family)